MTKYIIDANILITAYRKTYPMDVVPTFWERILLEFESETTYIIDFVFEEIRRGEDMLWDWIEENIDLITVLKSDNPKVVQSYREVINETVNDTQYTDKAKIDFASNADSWLIAHAKAMDIVLVTEEVYIKDIKKRVPIPNECRKHDVVYVNTIDYLRNTGTKI